MPLTGPEIANICEAIATSFTKEELIKAVRVKLSTDLSRNVNVDAAVDTMIFNFVAYCDRQGRVGELLKALLESNSNPELHQALASAGSTASAATATATAGPTPGRQVTASGAGAVAIGGDASNVRITTGHTDQSGGMHFHADNIYIGEANTQKDASRHVNITARDMTNVNVGIDQQIQDSFKLIQQAPASELKSLLETLHRQVTEMLGHPSFQNVKDVDEEDVGKDLEALAREAIKNPPRPKRLKPSAEGLIEAAGATGAIGEPVIGTVQKVMQLLSV